MTTLKGWLGEEHGERDGITYRWLYYKCPVHGDKHNDCIPVSLLYPACNVNGFEIWHGELKDNILTVTPSISNTVCGYHDFYQFELVEEGVIGSETIYDDI